MTTPTVDTAIIASLGNQLQYCKSLFRALLEDPTDRAGQIEEVIADIDRTLSAEYTHKAIERVDELEAIATSVAQMDITGLVRAGQQLGVVKAALDKVSDQWEYLEPVAGFPR